MKKYLVISFVVLFGVSIFAKKHEEVLHLCDVAVKEISDQAQDALTLKKRKEDPSSQELRRIYRRTRKERGKLGKKFLNILTYFSNMFHHFICLLQRVNDEKGIQEPILGLFESMAHIIMEGIKNGKLSPDATPGELQVYLEKVSKNIAPHVRSMIIKHSIDTAL